MSDQTRAGLPYSASADRNKEAIGDALADYFDCAATVPASTVLAGTVLAGTVLEIGSGSGQHAVYLCQRFGHLRWQVTEQKQYLDGLKAAVTHAALNNILDPVELEVSAAAIKNDKSIDTNYSFVYSANTAHIMGIVQVEAMFALVGQCLSDDGLFALYGPFTENGQHNSEGNRDFDASLRLQDPVMGIRDIAELEVFAKNNNLSLSKQIAMPANNRILLWCKS